MGSHIPFIHHGGQTPQAPLPGTGQGTSGAPQYDDYGRIVGYSPTQTNAPSATPNAPAQSNTGGLDLHTLWGVLSQMGLFNGTVGAPPPAATPSTNSSPANTSTGTLPNQALLSAIANILGIQVAPPSNGGQSQQQAVPFGPSSTPGLFNDGQGSFTHSATTDENSQYGYWGEAAYASNNNDGYMFHPHLTPMQAS